MPETGTFAPSTEPTTSVSSTSTRATLWHAHRNIRLRLLVSFTNRFVSFMLNPLMTVLFAASFGPARAGLLLSLVVVTTVGATFLGGHLADVRGRRPLLILSEGGVVVAYAAMALVNSPLVHSVPATYVCFLLISGLGGMGFPANDAVMIDVATPSNRSAIYTANYWLMNLAFAGGALVGGVFHTDHFGWLIALGLVLSSVSLVATVLGLAETRPAQQLAGRGAGRGVRAAMGGYREAAADRIFLRVLLSAVLVTGLNVQLTYYIAVDLAARFTPRTLFSLHHWHLHVDGLGMLSVLRILNTVLVVVLALWVARWAKRVPDRVRIYGGIGVYTAGFVGIVLTHRPWVLIGLSVLYTVGELASVPPRQVLLAQVVPAASRSKYMALYGMRPRAGALLGSATVAAAGFLTPPLAAGLFAAMGAGAIVLLRVPLRVARDHTAREATSADAPAPAPDTAVGVGAACAVDAPADPLAVRR